MRTAAAHDQAARDELIPPKHDATTSVQDYNSKQPSAKKITPLGLKS
jgi:hypothetical protein